MAGLLVALPLHLDPGRWHLMSGEVARRMDLPLKHARLCLDCDWLTDLQSCSQCGGHGTVPIAAWFRPLEERTAGGGSARTGRTRSAPRRFILVVQPQQRELYRILRQALEGTGVDVFYERRVGQRRRVAAGPTAAERRRIDRRRPRPSAIAYEVALAPAELKSAPRPSAGRGGVPVPRPTRRQPTPA
jgi:hypothetical protein